MEKSEGKLVQSQLMARATSALLYFINWKIGGNGNEINWRKSESENIHTIPRYPYD